ncbi:MAG: hypothetical protein MJ180_02470 [Candidatus Gastranaerophilales bacterium]|nr:hypothetical protein [Candidatus Gastranaerophilales bacterium]
MSWSDKEAFKELSDPNSVYYLGNPSPFVQVQNYLNGFGGRGYYNTNYFGANKARYLAPRMSDSVEIMGAIKKRNDFNSRVPKVGIGAAAILSLLVARKIPGVNLIFPAIGGLFRGIGWAIGGIFRGLGKLFK